MRVVRFRPVGASGVVLWMRGWRIGRWRSYGTLSWRVIRRSRFFGRCNCGIVKRSRLGSGRDRRLAVICGSTQLWVCAGCLHVLSLSGYRRNRSRACRGLFFRSRACVCPTIAAVVADAVHGGIVDYRCVVHIVDVGDVHIVHRAVVVKLFALPASAFIALAKVSVSVSVTDPAVEPDGRSPVAIIEDISVKTYPLSLQLEQPGVYSRPASGGITQVPGTQ